MMEYQDYRLISYDAPPPGRFRSTYPLTGFSVQSDSFESLVQMTERHLKANGRASIRARMIVEMSTVKNLFEEKHFSHIKKTKGKRNILEYWRGTKYAVKIEQFIKDGVDPLVSLGVSNFRASICVDCPHNVTFKTNKIDEAAEEYLRGRVHNRQTTFDGQINKCNVCSCDLKTMVHLSEGVITSIPEKSLSSYPPQCWKRKAYENV